MDTLPLVSPDQVGLSAARLARISSWMRGWVDSGKLPGMTVCVMRRGELAYAETYGKADVERNQPMRPHTIVRIYSMTKPLTSTAIMMLYEEGRFQLDEPISKFIPAFKNPRVYAGGSRGKIEPAFEYGFNVGPTNVFFSGSFHRKNAGLPSPDGSAQPNHDRSDEIELGAVKRLFGNAMGKLSMSSTKSAIGHLLGGAGGLEAGITVMAIRDQIAPPTINYENPDPECDLDYVPNVARTGLQVDRVLINGFGFGGQNASVLFGKLG